MEGSEEHFPSAKGVTMHKGTQTKESLIEEKEVGDGNKSAIKKKIFRMVSSDIS